MSDSFSHDPDSDHLAHRGAAPAEERAPGERAGETIDRYELIREIGEGGMGTVWLARQSQPVKREVALKIIKLGMDTREVVVRFEAERQALALMDHPHIAKVLDGGATENGRPFFVMEFVEGVPITEYCDEAKLGLRERLELFAEVCQGIQHAHQKGIIHRDVKPGNVLVALQDGQPVPKVIDFGIAKATGVELTERTMATQLGQMLGTPEYMAPEQLGMSGLDIDTRADVYSLGVLLYELLTGTKPFDIQQVIATGYDELLRTIREVDPDKPSTRITRVGDSATSIAASRRVDTKTLGKGLGGDLDWIVMKALEKDRARRYETANGFAADVTRFLNDEPVVAAPPSALYRFRKFVRRRKKTVAAAAAIVFLLIAGSIGTGVGLWKTIQANKSLDLALDEKDEALLEEGRQRELAQENERRARDAEEDARREAERAQLAEAESRARSAELEQVADFQAEQLSEIDPELMGLRLRRALLDAAHDERREALTASLAGINFTTLALGTLEANLFGRTLDAIDSQFADQPLVRARLLQTVASTLVALGLLDAATAPQEQALSIRRSALGDDHPSTLDSIIDMGFLLEARGRQSEAELFFREGLEGNRRVLGDDHPDTLVSINNLGSILYIQGKRSEAEPFFREALEGRRRVHGDDHPHTLTSINNMGGLLQARGKLSEAEPFLREALEGQRRVLGDDHPNTFRSLNNMGVLLYAQGKLAEAERFYREALEGHRRVQGDDHPDTLAALNNLGDLLQARGKLSDAEPFLREALEGRRRVLGEDHPNTLLAIDSLADLLNARVRAARSGGDGEPLGRALASLGAHHLDLGDHARAEPFLAEAMEALYGAIPESDPLVWQVLSDLGASIAGQGRNEEAESLLRDSAARMLENSFATSELGDANAAALGVAPPATLVQRMIDLYEAWHELEPGAGHDRNAREWRVAQEAWLAGTETGSRR